MVYFGGRLMLETFKELFDAAGLPTDGFLFMIRSILFSKIWFSRFCSFVWYCSNALNFRLPRAGLLLLVECLYLGLLFWTVALMFDRLFTRDLFSYLCL